MLQPNHCPQVQICQTQQSKGTAEQILDSSYNLCMMTVSSPTLLRNQCEGLLKADANRVKAVCASLVAAGKGSRHLLANEGPPRLHCRSADRQTGPAPSLGHPIATKGPRLRRACPAASINKAEGSDWV